MSKPNFQGMSQKELRDYFLTHRDDREAFYAYIDSVGESNQGRILIVSYTERGDLIRLISARVVTRAERQAYEEG